MTTDDPVAFAPPPAFGPFRVLHQIGIGALGPVFRTYEPTRDRLIAVKVFRLDITPEQAQVLADQLSRASDAGLFHPSIVEPIAAGVEGTVAYRAEEYVAAESLDVAIRHYAPASLDKALPFLTQLAGAVDFARAAGIGHGALHLRDIFVTPEEARASGFGVVEALERVGLRAPVRRPYSAPERIAGERWGTPADVFSLGAIAYELLTARRPAGTGDQMGPFTGEHLLEFGAGIRVVLARAMDDLPARRYPTALAFASALEAAARGGRVTEAVTTVGAISADTTPSAPVQSSPGTVLGLSGAAALEPSGTDDALSADLPLAAEEHDDLADVAYSDISDERDDDAAYYELEKAHDAEPERLLFDDESAADLGLAPHHDAARLVPPPHRLWEDEPAPARDLPPERGSRERDTGRYDRAVPTGTEEYPADGEESGRDGDVVSDPERPRPAVLPVAVTLILGLLIGFAAGYWAGGREAGTRARSAGAATTAAPSANVPDATTGTPAKGAGQAYSEQAVAQPPVTPPAIPDEGPRTPAPGRARPAVPAVTSGRIAVTSNPSRASVTVDGRWRGRTPLTLEGIKFGAHSVRVVLPGFTVAHEEVIVSASEPARNVVLRLQPAPAAPAAASRGAAAPGAPTTAVRPVAPFTGSIYVDSRPRGARILIDNQFAGTTPARIPDVLIGSHIVKLELPEHHAWTVGTQVSAGQETRVTGSLERIP